MFRLRSALAVATLVTGAAVAFAAPALAQDGGSGGAIGQSSGNSAAAGSTQQGAGSTAGATPKAGDDAKCDGAQGSPCAKGDNQVSDVPSGSADAGGGSTAGAPVALVTAGGLTLIGAGGAGAFAMSRRGRARHTA